ncbi:DUF6745 domain-containing protein [Hwanghaeella sp.]|uniref:DUF6745 domain-containing protein n=1 Tax=Hwanghaeella sp. TaxID=2605943 RepID=UPI003CCB7697
METVDEFAAGQDKAGTAGEAARLLRHQLEWIRIGFETEPAGRLTAERAVVAVYRAAGFDPPRILWCGSPLTMAFARAVLATNLSLAQQQRVASAMRESIDTDDWPAFWTGVQAAGAACRGMDPGPCLKDAVVARVRDMARADLQQRLGPVRWESIVQAVGVPVRRRIGAGVWSVIGRGIWNSVRISAPLSQWGAFRAEVRDAIWQSAHGQHDAPWLAVHDYCAADGHGEVPRALTALSTLARSAGWWLPHEKICWICERPRIVEQDEDGVLHSAAGPAVAYPDGWGLYAWRGSLVPRRWIENPGGLTPRIALTHPYVEQRRAACEILGWERVLSALETRVIQADDDPMIGELVEAEIPEIGRERFLRVLCGTGRRFALPVPPGMTSALAANAWTYGLEAAELNPEVRT